MKCNNQGLLQMVKIVGFGRGKEWEVKARVGIQRGQQCDGKPQPIRHHVASEQEGSQERWQQVGEDVFDWVSIDGSDGYR
ncbi:hypothetical protein CEXT_666101 [Caerostris extrusa]|uniref:Uncharacterized protein n=1 Tax=Caerostris extrusa TaxID=172846 RepID=A0AAV4VD80_CAEEX|nr:hypothetical protein CEXT_666101 [Caerostris extrusa]